MTDAQRRLTGQLRRLLVAAVSPELQAAVAAGGFPDALWAALDQAKLPRAGMPRATEGLDQGLETLLALAALAGAAAAPVPLAESLLGHYALAQAGLAPPLGPLTIGPVRRDDAPGFAGGLLQGRLRQLPWARHAAAAVVVVAGPDGHRTILAGRPAVGQRSVNLAGEPRDLVLLEETPVLAAGSPGRGLSPGGLYRLGALFRAAATAGALDAASRLTLRYGRQRRADGRPPLGQPELAQAMVRLAAEAAAARIAWTTAARVAVGGPARFEVACAKLRVATAAATGAALAHRIHGPASLAPDHPLAALTRRLWAWREEFGGEAEWAGRVGRLARAAGGAGLWPLIADRGRMPAPTRLGEMP